MMLTFVLIGSCDYVGFHFPMLMSDQDRTALDNIHTISTRYVMRIKKNITLGIISWFNPKLSELTLQELYGWQLGGLHIWSGSLRVKNYSEW